MLLDGHADASGILLLGGGINPLMIVLICYVGLNLLIAVTIYLSVSFYNYDIFNKRTSLNFSDYYHHNTSPTRAHDLTTAPLQSTINSYQLLFFCE